MQVTGEAMMTEEVLRDRVRAILRGVLIISRVSGALVALFGLCLIIPLDRVGVPV